MNKTQFLEYFKNNKLSSSDNTEITVTKVVTSATQIISNAELSLVEDEIEVKISENNPLKKSEEKLGFMLIVLELLQ